jgi:integrase
MGQVIRKVNRAGRFIGWYVRYVDSDGKRKARATKATSAAEARRILVELEAAAGRRQLGVPDRPQPVKGTALVARWLDESQPRTTDRAKWAQKQRYHLARAMPHLDAIITRPDAVRIVRQIGAAMKPSTLRLARDTLKAAWAWAVAEGVAADNPWAVVRLQPVERKCDYLSRDEVAALIATADADKCRNSAVSAIGVRLAVYAGLRVSEIYGLRWRSVDFDRNVITIRSGYTTAPTKSRRERVIPMADHLRDALIAWRSTCPSTDVVCPAYNTTTGKWFAALRRPDIKRLYRKAGLHAPSAPWHVLRHTFASHFLMAGGSLLTLQRLLGHASVAITQIYSHLSDEHVAGEIKKLRF